MSQIEEMSIEVEQGGAGIEAGDTCTGVIQGSTTKTFEHGGEEITYYELTIEEEEVGLEFTPDWPARITPGTGLGRLVQRFGAELKVGQPVDLHEVFSAGQKVTFEVAEEEGDEEDENGEKRTFLVVDEDTVRPADQDAPSRPQEDVDTSDDDDEDDDLRPEVLEIIDENEGEEESDIKRELARESGDHVKAYKSLKSDGDVEVEDGLVFLAS